MPNKKYPLDKAREAVKLKNYADALNIYNNFFDITFKNSAKYGVRLSYCLSEWRKLGDIYPPALEKLENKRDETLLLFKNKREAERFHDYIAICQQLKTPEFPMEEFIHLHKTDKTLATQIVRFIWDALIENKEWKICIEYLDDPLEKYKIYLTNFDALFKKYVHDNSTDNDKEIFSHSLNWYIKEVTNILLVLNNSNKIEEYNHLRKHISSDFKSRGLSKLEILIDRELTNYQKHDNLTDF